PEGGCDEKRQDGVLAAEFHGSPLSCHRWSMADRSANLTEPASIRKGLVPEVRKTLSAATRRSARVACCLVGPLQGRRPLAQAGNPVLRVGVGGQPFRLAAAGGIDHVLPQVDRL